MSTGATSCGWVHLMWVPVRLAASYTAGNYCRENVDLSEEILFQVQPHNFVQLVTYPNTIGWHFGSILLLPLNGQIWNSLTPPKNGQTFQSGSSNLIKLCPHRPINRFWWHTWQKPWWLRMFSVRSTTQKNKRNNIMQASTRTIPPTNGAKCGPRPTEFACQKVTHSRFGFSGTLSRSTAEWNCVNSDYICMYECKQTPRCW